MNTTAPIPRFLAFLLRRALFAWAYQRGVIETEATYVDIREERETRERNCYEAGYSDCEARIPALLTYAREDAEKRGYRRGAHEHGQVSLEVCAEHGTKLVRLRDGLHLTFGLCRHIHEARVTASDPVRDTDGVIPRALADTPTQRKGAPPHPIALSFTRGDAPPHTGYGLPAQRLTRKLRESAPGGKPQ